ncbi:unnamed protein product [Rotaria magnacalcarata]|uniref:G-protein coupled receptors family 1 profile domain-containing protein n=1 Tax=Rotaria magnacalcarata TaxID=392030 RepID=A0A816SZX4_9BILA|nr:unnamed protein product [Rotaria magnacalcarata]CAF1660596.1 unnamed protein product [Rotaria magnacalcarata]CAF2067220.1 unnamed protein product [Rotaria magnacalcarata]CAF2089230.1 unnamed protein product [Rotaria magnacalcarata]CAF2131007.1 unnamed protein product [Rotaria magnacalcarata]
MNNSTSSICSSNQTEIDVLVWQIGALLFPIVGIPGHLLMIITMLMSNRRRSQPTSLYFIFISVTETIYLLFIFWDWLDAVNLVRDPRQVLDCGLFYPFVHGTGFISLIIFVQLNIDRICMISKPQQTYSCLTRKRILVKITLAFSTLLLFIFHYRFSLHYDSNGFIIYGQSCRVRERAHRWYYSIWPYIHLICRLTPCVLLIYCTIYIFYNRYYENNDRKTSSHRQQQKFSLVLVVVGIYTLTALIPITILQIFNQTMWKYEFECFSCHCIENNILAKNWKLLNALCIMWETSIYMNKFYIKYLFSSDFRYDVKQVMFYRNTTETTNRN